MSSPRDDDPPAARPGAPDDLREPVRQALRRLQIDRLALTVHDASFPSRADEDIGRGSPCSRGGADLLRFAAALGFDTIQLGPQGQTARDDASPYDGTWLSRNEMSIALWPLAFEPRWDGLLSESTLGRLVRGSDARSRRARHAAAFDAIQEAMREVHARFVERRAAGDPTARAIDADLQAFAAAHAGWLEHDARYAALSDAHGGAGWRDWPAPWREPSGVSAARWSELERTHAPRLERYRLSQLIAHRQHAQLRAHAQSLGLSLRGDVQVGMSYVDEWGRGQLFLEGYRLGAPPSRTNPDGQPWGYAVLDPALDDSGGEAGPALRLSMMRLGKLLDEYDGLRLDHPHGMVCPWVYAADAADPIAAVRSGARLFSSPDLVDHPRLSRYAIVAAEQLDRGRPRHDDRWVRELTEAQVAAYARRVDAVVELCALRGRGPDSLAAEVLSTCPRPLARVLERHGLGRFRVTSTAHPEYPHDVYRSDNARPEDWIMMTTHDTPPIWRRASDWLRDGTAAKRARYLGERLRPHDPSGAAALAAELQAGRAKLAHAELADVLASDARNVMLFFSDLLGYEEIYNRPGTVREDNWTLRAPSDLPARYAAASSRGEALDLPCALALALRARGHGRGDGLVRWLEARSFWVPR